MSAGRGAEKVAQLVVVFGFLGDLPAQSGRKIAERGFQVSAEFCSGRAHLSGSEVSCYSVPYIVSLLNVRPVINSPSVKSGLGISTD